MKENPSHIAPPAPHHPPPSPKGTDTKVRINHLREMKVIGRPIVMITAYDSTMARLVDNADVDMILVGDSVGNTLHGLSTTLEVTMEMMVLHTRAVTRGGRRAFVVADMPFMSYHISPEDARRNAGRLIAEGRADAVKLESYHPESIETVASIVRCGIPVMGHLGLVPQAVLAMGGYRVQGRTENAAEQLRDMAVQLENAGAFSLVLEGIPAELAADITSQLSIPTIGIGAGVGCDGQVLVSHDLLGFTEHPPKFARPFANLAEASSRAFRKFARDVREKRFPGEENTYH